MRSTLLQPLDWCNGRLEPASFGIFGNQNHLATYLHGHLHEFGGHETGQRVSGELPSSRALRALSGGQPSGLNGSEADGATCLPCFSDRDLVHFVHSRGPKAAEWQEGRLVWSHATRSRWVVVACDNAENRVVPSPTFFRIHHSQDATGLTQLVDLRLGSPSSSRWRSVDPDTHFNLEYITQESAVSYCPTRANPGQSGGWVQRCDSVSRRCAPRRREWRSTGHAAPKLLLGPSWGIEPYDNFHSNLTPGFKGATRRDEVGDAGAAASCLAKYSNRASAPVVRLKNESENCLTVHGEIYEPRPF